MTTQLICLPFYMDDRDVAYRATQCWYSLSSACHAHPYKLAPTVAELERWLEEVAAFISTVPVEFVSGARNGVNAAIAVATVVGVGVWPAEVMLTSMCPEFGVWLPT